MIYRGIIMQTTYKCPKCHAVYVLTVTAKTAKGVTVHNHSLMPAQPYQLEAVFVEGKNYKTGQPTTQFKINGIAIYCEHCNEFVQGVKQEEPKKPSYKEDAATKAMKNRFRMAPKRDEDDGLL
jgi:ssDNA-binding Zn-finger/Zn-ribbon topoisomerase 1